MVTSGDSNDHRSSGAAAPPEVHVSMRVITERLVFLGSVTILMGLFTSSLFLTYGLYRRPLFYLVFPLNMACWALAADVTRVLQPIAPKTLRKMILVVVPAVAFLCVIVFDALLARDLLGHSGAGGSMLFVVSLLPVLLTMDIYLAAKLIGAARRSKSCNGVKRRER